MRSLSRGIVGSLSGGAQPLHVAGAIVVGVLAGALVGFNYAFVALLLTALVWNLHGKTLLASFAAGAAGGYLLETEIYQLGRWLLERPTAHRAINALGEGPWATLWGVNDYRVVGALAAATAISLPVALWMAWLIRGERTRSVSAGGVGGWRFSTLTARLLIGGDAQHRRQVMTAAPCTIRPCGLFAAVAIGPIALTFVWCVTAETAVETLLAGLSSGNRAPVRAGAIDYSMWTGKLAIDDLRFADPDDRSQDRLRIRRVTGVVRPAALLCGRIEADQLQVAGLRTDVSRKGSTRSEPMDSYRLQEAAIGADAAPSAASDRADAPLPLHGNIRGFDQVAARLGGVVELIAELRQWADQGRSTPANFHSPRGPRRCLPRAGQPEMMVDAAQFEDLPRAWNLGPRASIEIANLNSDPVASGRPTTLRAVIPKLSAEMSVRINLHEPEQPHDVAVQAYGLPLVRLAALDRYGPEVEIIGGVIDITGEGWADDRQLQVPLRIDAQQLHVRAGGAQPIAGLPPELWNAGVARLERLRVEVQLVGAWSRPRIEIDQADLVRAFHQQLHAAGAEQLVAAINESFTPRPATAEKTHVAAAATTNDRSRSVKPESPTISVEAPPQVVQEDATRVATRAQPGLYPRTETPTGWVPAPATDVNTPAASGMAFTESPPAEMQPIETQPNIEPSASFAIVEKETQRVPDATLATAQPIVATAQPIVATARPIATPAAVDPPPPVDLTLGYDSAPFDTIDRHLTQSVELREAAESFQRQLADEVLAEAEAPTSALVDWTGRARSALTRAWPFTQSRAPGAEALADEIVPDYYPDELDTWQTIEPPPQPAATAADRPWYERVWQ